VERGFLFGSSNITTLSIMGRANSPLLPRSKRSVLST
jgi:hypothetical protein